MGTMSDKVVQGVGLDIGSTRTRCIVLQVENGRVRYLGHGVSESRGWEKGALRNQRAGTESVQAAVKAAEKSSGISIESVAAGVGGPYTRGSTVRDGIRLSRPRPVEDGDVRRLSDRASAIPLPEDRMALQAFPQDFVVDGHPGYHDPRQMFAFHLEVNLYLVTTSIAEHHSLQLAINLAGYEVESTVYEPVAAALATMMPEDRREGIALIDIGAHSTGVVLYYGDSVQLATSLPLGGELFTLDVARYYGLSYEEAETIKKEYGEASQSATSSASYFELPGPEHKEARRWTLNGILESRAFELFTMVQNELIRVGMDRALIGGVLLTGSGAQLDGLCDVAHRTLKCAVHKGLPGGMLDLPAELEDPEWAVAAGLAMHSAALRRKRPTSRQRVGRLARILG